MPDNVRSTFLSTFRSNPNSNRSTFLFICSTSSTLTTDLQKYSNRQNLVQNKNIDVQNLDNRGSFPFATQWRFLNGITVPKNDFSIFLMFPKGPPSFFLKFCNQLAFHKTQRVPPFTILSLRYSADLDRSWLVHYSTKQK